MLVGRTVELNYIHMTYDRSLFIKIYYQEGAMSIEFGDDATYLMREVTYISSLTPKSDVFELINVLFVLGLKKNNLSISCMVDI